MLFNSIDFLVFATIVVLLYRFLGHRNQNRMLLVASYVFYGWWDWRFLSLIALSTLVDFFCAQAIARRDDSRGRRRLLWVSLVTNLGVLGFFKYFDFFVTSAATTLSTLGFQVAHPTLHIVLPVGISFYTFQTLGYTIDVYRGERPPERRFDTFALYVAYFPQLVAGPIERSQRLLPQLDRPRSVTASDWTIGFQLLVYGFFMKLCVADGVAPYVDRAFANPDELNAVEMLFSVHLFALQIYGDFAGYTNIARGVSRLFGIRLSLNFRQPYLSESVTEFWRRWHISLSSWLRDYLYIPLGGNRSGTFRTYRNLGLTMLLGGLWHGASWNFVIWGGLHGVLLALHRLWRRDRSQPSRPGGAKGWMARWLRIAVTFHLVCLLWIFFRAVDLPAAAAVFDTLCSSWARPPLDFTLVWGILLGVVLLLDLAAQDNEDSLPIRDGWPAWTCGLVYAAMIVAISFIGDANVRPFIYFQF